jgi:hypothetical protein
VILYHQGRAQLGSAFFAFSDEMEPEISGQQSFYTPNHKPALKILPKTRISLIFFPHGANIICLRQ